MVSVAQVLFTQSSILLPNSTKCHALYSTGIQQGITTGPLRHKHRIVCVSVLEVCSRVMVQPHQIWHGEIYLHTAVKNSRW